MKNKKILITGAKGFIGTHLQRALSKEGFHVIPYDIVMGKEYDIFSQNIEEDIKKADVVVHLAALTSVEQSFKDQEEVFRVNVLGTARIVELCHKYKKKLLFPSSAAVYHSELSPYAQTKLLGESMVASMSKSNVVFRLYNVFGPDMNPNSGSIIYNFLTSDKIVVFGDGEQTRDFIHVRDVVSIMIDAIKFKKYNGAIVDLGTGQAYSTNYVAGLFAYFRGKDVHYKEPRREIKWSIANIQLLKKLYKKPLTTKLEKDIKELINYYYEN